MASHHVARESVGMPQKPVGLGNIALRQEAPDAGGGNGQPLHFLLRYHPAGDASLFAGGQELFAVARPPVPEAEIVAADDAPGVKFRQEPLKIVLPRGVHQCVVKGQHDDTLHTHFPKQGLPVGDGVDKAGGLALHQSVRVISKGLHPGGAAVFRRQGLAGIQQGLMAQMHPVKKPRA